MIEVNVKKNFGDVTIDVSFKVPDRGITVLYGHSGAGKTSIINMMAGLLTPDTGYITVNDRVLFDSIRKINIAPDKRNAGYMFQDKRLFNFMSVKKNLLFGRHKSRASHADFDGIVELLGISHLLNRKPVLLSGGEGQRVAMGRAILSEPDFILMDEPMSSLDQDRKNELIPYISKIPEKFGTPVILVTHSHDEALLLADQMVVLGQGKVLSQVGADSIMSGLHSFSELRLAQ